MGFNTFYNFLEDNQPIESWLGNSVIRQPVYHGTNKSFDEFKLMPSKRYVLFSEFDVQAQGFFFSENKETAKEYGRNILTCYVRMTNPLLDPRKYPHLSVDKLPDREEARLAFILRNAVKDKTLETGVSARHIPKFKQDLYARERMDKSKARMFGNNYDWIYYVIGRGGLAWDMLDMPKVVQSMKRFGFDGTFVDEDNDSTGRSIFVMSADQIMVVEKERPSRY